ncbi:MAG: trimethylamine methyltransferase family protein [Candidatus Atribacteria bacterium]|nr:trimethylamine methyltransferase family protein [Candidatus Atribacteria bacterium]
MQLTDLKVLSENEILAIHKNSLVILESIGLRVESEKILDLLQENGCQVDFKNKRVRFPANIVEKCLLTVPKQIPIYQRDGNLAFILGDGGQYCVSGHNAVFVLEDETGKRRDSTVKDVENFAILSDKLSEVDMVGVPVMPQDVTPQTTLLYAIQTILENSLKPIFFSSESEMINQAVIDMGKVVTGKENLNGCSPIISQLSTTSPLYWEKGAAEALYIVSQEGIPLDLLPQPIAGVTAPYTLAGLLTVHNTEVLSGIVISQLIRPGTPIIYGAAWTTYEMKQANVLIGRPESSLLRVAGAQMAHYYNIPSHTTAPDNDANLLDEQAAWEKMLSTLAGIIGTNDMIVNLGMFGTGMTISLEQLIMDNEMCRIAKRFRRGIEVNKDTLALDTILQVGPRGEFLTSEHTLHHLRSGEHVSLDVSNGANYEVWKQKGSKNSTKKASDIVSSILHYGCQNPLPTDQQKEIHSIINQYEKRMGLR